MTYAESDALMRDVDFRGRIKVAALKYADAIMNEEGSVPAHNTRTRWALNTMQQPDQVAMQLQPPTVMDGAVQSAGADITDDALQGSVEAVIRKML